MKKIFTLAALAALTTFGVSAEAQVANPVTPEGEVIVKWDLEKGTWAEANDFEVDETFCFAVDVTGIDALTGFLNGTPRDPNVKGRSLGFAFYTTNLDAPGGANIDGRLWKIKDNIYGCIINLFQHAAGRYLDGWFVPNADFTSYLATTAGQTTSFNTPVFGFGYSEDNPGAEWWQEPQEGLIPFSTLPYTGTRTSPEFYKEDTDELAPFFFAGSFSDWKGYAAPTLEVWKAVTDPAGVEAVEAGIAAVVATEYYDLNGIRLAEAPEAGICIAKKLLSNGSIKVEKIVK